MQVIPSTAASATFAGAVPRNDVGNLSATYTQNTNASKMDVFQRRTVKEVVQLRVDGSARVTRTVTLTNDSPRYLGTGPDPGHGYTTRWAGAAVIAMMPRGARIVGQPTATGSFSVAKHAVQVRGVKTGTDQGGRPYAQAELLLPPRASGSVTWSYVVPNATVRHGNALRFLDYLAPQSTLNAPSLQLEVHAPKGWTVQPATGWTVDGGSATTQLSANRSAVLKVQVAPSP